MRQIYPPEVSPLSPPGAAGPRDRLLEGAFWSAMLVLTALVVYPLLAADVLPCTDLPGHLALVSAMRHLGEAGHPLAKHFRWGLFPAPNSLFYLLAYLLSMASGSLLFAGRVIVALAAAALPWAVLLLLRSCGRERWLALAAFPLAVQWPLTEGFVDYWLGLSVTLVGLALLQDYLARGGVRRATAVVLTSIVLFFAHVQCLLYFGLGTALLLALERGAWRRRGSASRSTWHELGRTGAIALGGPLLLGGQWILRTWLDFVPRFSSAVTPESPTLSGRVKGLPALTLATVDAGGTRLFWIVVGAGWLAAWVGLLTTKRQKDDGSTRQRLPEALAAALGVLYLVTPPVLGPYWNLHSRVPAVALLLAVPLLLAPGARFRWRLAPLVFALPLVLATGYVSVQLRAATARWNSYTAGFWRVLEAAPAGSRLLYAADRWPRKTGFRSRTWRHLGQYHTVINGGTTSFSFAEMPGRLVVQRERGFDCELADQSLLGRLVFSACRYDLVLHRGFPLEVRHPAHLQLLAREGSWALYRPRSCAAQAKD